MKRTVWLLLAFFASFPCGASERGSLSSTTPKTLLGVQLSQQPSHEGSDERVYKFSPYVQVRVGGKKKARISNQTFNIDLINEGNFIAGGTLKIRPGRTAPKNSLHQRLPEVDKTTEIGAYLRVEKPISDRDLLYFKTAFLSDPFSTGHKGSVWTLATGWEKRIHPKLSLDLELETTLASKRYMNKFFGVSTKSATKTGLKPYNPNSGFKDVTLKITTDYLFSEEWILQVTGSGRWYTNEAADSPTVEYPHGPYREGHTNEIQLWGGLSLIHQF